jgi:Omp85 superfamily domain
VIKIFQRFRNKAALCVFTVVILMSSPSARAQAPPATPAQPANATPAPSTSSPNSIQNTGAALGDYADRVAPLLPAGDDNDQTLEVVPGTFGLPAAAPSTSETTTNSAPPEAKKGEWLIAPLPNYSPTFGFGVIGRLAYIFPLNPKDTVSPPSVVGAFGYYSENNSWAAGLATKLFIDEDRYRVTAAALHGDFKYDFSGIGTDAGTSGQYIPLEQKMTGGIFETLIQVAPNFYVGPKYVGSKMNFNVDSSGMDPFFAIPTNEVNSTSSALGLHAQWDTRDSQFYPRTGYLADADISFHDPALGDSFSYQAYTLSYNRYISLASNQVLALRAMGQFESGNVPFYALSKFGRGSDLRGYTIGQFQDTQMFAVQGEYRLEITKRIGTVAFAGVGGVMPSLNAIAFDELLPSGGVGLRYVVAEKNHVAVRFDAAWGREGSQFYLTVGEAF